MNLANKPDTPQRKVDKIVSSVQSFFVVLSLLSSLSKKFQKKRAERSSQLKVTVLISQVHQFLAQLELTRCGITIFKKLSHQLLGWVKVIAFASINASTHVLLLHLRQKQRHLFNNILDRFFNKWKMRASQNDRINVSFIRC